MHSQTINQIILNKIQCTKEKEFQKLGDRLLTTLFPDDYHSTRAGGRYGDFSNDGYSPKSRIFFHFYAPFREDSKKLKVKMRSDVANCLKKQKDVNKIVYITNAPFLGEIETYIDEMKRKLNIDIETWGPERIVDKMGNLPVKAIGYIIGMSLDSLERDEAQNNGIISYKPHEGTLKRHSERMVKIRGLLSVGLLVIAAFLSVLNIPLNISPLIGLFVLLSFGIAATQFKYMVMLTSVSAKEVRIKSFFNVRFYKKEGKIYLEYGKVGYCTIPGCQGKVFTGLPPEREKNRFPVVGYCSKEKTLHTYSINDDNIGYPVQLNFEPIPQK